MTAGIEKQSDKKATLHVGSDPTLTASGTKISVHLCGLLVRPEGCEDNHGGEEPHKRD